MAWTAPDPLDGGTPEAAAAGGAAPAWQPPDQLLGLGRPRSAQGFFDSVVAGWQSSSAGLWLRGKTPDVFVNPDLPWYERLGGSLSGLAGDAPAMAIGGFAGAAIPLPGFAKGPATGAGAFVAPAVVREALMSYYETGEVDYGKLAATGAKEAVVGAATFWAGGAVSRLLPGAIEGTGRAARIAQSLGRQTAIGGAELGAMMSARSVVDWRIPEAHEFFDNAVLIFGLRGAREYGIPALMRIYERTGKTPEEVRGDTMRDSDIAQEVLQGRVPGAYRPLEQEARGDTPPEFVPPAPLRDPGPSALDRASHNLRHIADEATMKAELERAGTEHLAQIEAARRGTVSREETLAASEQAKSWLQDLLGAGRETRKVGTPAGDAEIVAYARVTESTLTAYRQAGVKLDSLKVFGAGAKEIEAARVDFATKEAQLRAITADYLGATAEIGRALNAIKYIKEAIGNPAKLAEALKKGGASAESLDFRASLVKNMKSNKELTDLARNPTTFDKIVEWWKASVLSGPGTQMVNFVSNVFFAGTRPFRTFGAAAISEARGKDTVLYREAAAEAAGLVMGLTEGFKAAGRVIAKAYTGTGEHVEITGKAEIHKAAIGGALGKVVRTPFVLLEAADAMAKTVNSYATLYGSASRASKGDAGKLLSREFWTEELAKARMSESTLLKIQEDALRFTFQTDLGPTAKRLLGALYDSPARYVLPFFLPFVRTPINIYSEAVRMMPGLAVLSKRGRDAWNEGGTARERMVADQIVGGAVALTFISLADAGIVSGAGPVDKRARDALIERGWQPYSIRFGDEWWSYARIEPLATLIGTMVDLWEVRRHVTQNEYDIAGHALLLAMRHQVTNKTWLLGVSTMIDLATADEFAGTKASKAVASVLGGFVPNLFVQTDRELDDHIRDTRGFVDTLMNRVPILRRGLLPKRDSLGEPMTQDSLFPFSGIRVSHEKGDPVREEMARVGYAPMAIRAEELEVAPGPLEAKIEISDQQLDSLRTTSGKIARVALEKVFASPAYVAAPLPFKRSIIEQVFSMARAHARAGAIPPAQLQQVIQEAAETTMAGPR